MMTGGLLAEQTCSQRFAASVRGVVTSMISTSILPRLNNLCISAPSFTTVTLKWFRQRVSETGSGATRVCRTNKTCAEKSMIGWRAPSFPLARARVRCLSVGGEAHPRLESVPQADHWTVVLSGRRTDRPPHGHACYSPMHVRRHRRRSAVGHPAAGDGHRLAATQILSNAHDPKSASSFTPYCGPGFSEVAA